MIYVDQLQLAVHIPSGLENRKSTQETIEAFCLYEDDDARVNFELSFWANKQGEE